MRTEIFITLLIFGLMGFGGLIALHQFGIFSLSEAFEFQAMLIVFVLVKILFWIIILSGNFNRTSFMFFAETSQEHPINARTPRS